MKANSFWFLLVLTVLIFSLSGCVSNEKKLEPIQKEDMTLNETENITNDIRNSTQIDPTPNPAADNGDWNIGEITPITTPKPIDTPKTEIRTLNTGIILKRDRSFNSYGKGELTVKNGLIFDAVVVLAPSNNLKESVFSTYIQAGDSFKIPTIPDNKYVLFYTIGKDWDRNVKKFTMPEGSSRFETELVFVTSDVYAMTYTATLNPVVDGNAITTYVDDDDFPK